MRGAFAAVVFVAASGALGSGCREMAPRPAFDSSLTDCIPADTLALAGVDLVQLRASALYRELPGGAAPFLTPLREASYLLLAYNGKDVLAVARGSFSEAPAGATLLARDLAVSGSPDAVRAATAQRNTGRTGAQWLVERAKVAPGSQIWAVARGGVTYPLSGDGANLNRFLSFAEYAVVGVQLNGGVHVEAAGGCRTPEDARRLEESLRAFITLAATGAGKNRALAELLHSVQVKQVGGMVSAAVSASAGEAAQVAGLAR